MYHKPYADESNNFNEERRREKNTTTSSLCEKVLWEREKKYVKLQIHLCMPQYETHTQRHAYVRPALSEQRHRININNWFFGEYRENIIASMQKAGV